MQGPNPAEPEPILSRIRNRQSSEFAPIPIDLAKPADRGFLQGESVDIFRAAIRNPNTRDPYERRLITFLKSIGMKPNDFVNLARTNSIYAEKKIISVLLEQSTRVPSSSDGLSSSKI
jgi:hypothetical protein